MSPSGSERVSISVTGPPHKSRAGRACMNIIAHGGWYVMPEEKDLPSAYYRALEAGMGIVIPVRDHNGRLVIARGPATDGSLSFDEFLAERPVWPGDPPVLAVQVCAEGLSRLLHRSLRHIEGVVPFLFGMTAPDMQNYMDGHIPIYVRQSDLETQPPFYEFAEGVWLDSFERDWFDDRLIIQHLRTGKLVTVVSPEIHGRPHEPMWNLLRSLQDKLGELSGSIQLCTERPQEARTHFGA